MTVFFDTSSNMHPYECDGPGRCVHCDRRIVTYTFGESETHLTGHYQHHPADCALCDPDYDGQPNEHRKDTDKDTAT